MSNQLPTTPDPIPPTSDGFGAAATALPSNTPIAGFAKGEFRFKQDGSPIPLGTAYRCLAAAFGWIKFNGRGQPPDRIVDAPGNPLPDRSELGDDDVSKWPLGIDGRPRDPWFADLMLVRDDNGAPCMFSTTSDTGIRAVGQLCREVVWGRYIHGPNAVPVIELQSRKLRNQYATPVPSFPIVRWITDTGNTSNVLAAPGPVPPVPEEAKPNNDKKPTRAERALQQRLGNKPSSDLADELNDEIPWR
jgi:hypothetical protein